MGAESVKAEMLMEAMDGLGGINPATAPESLKIGQWLSEPLRHSETKVLLLPAGTVLTREIIAKIRSMDLEVEAIFCLGNGAAPRGARQADLVEHYTKQRVSTERVAEAYGAMRDISFVLFCISAALAFAFTSVPFAVLSGGLLVAMLGNAWMSLRVLHRLSSLNKMFAGMRLSRA